MKEPFDEIRERTQHINNHIHWWLCLYGREAQQRERSPRDVERSTITCLREDAAALVAICDRMLAEGSETEAPPPPPPG